MKDRGDHPHLIETCKANYNGTRCVLPDGHDGRHEAQIILPADVGRMIDEHITMLEVQQKKLRRTRRWLWVATAANVGAAVLNIALALT